MRFLNRQDELRRLERLAKNQEGGFGVLYGRRRLGKTRLLLEWSSHHDAVYSVADQSTAAVQRRYFAESLALRLEGFADVEYPDWRTLFARLATEARRTRFRGPVILDEFPYLVLSAGELPSVLQNFLDHDAKEARLVLVIAGSSQRMMQGLVLDAAAPLYGRASEILEISPLRPTLLRTVFPRSSAADAVRNYAAWGGVPRYWELAAAARGSLESRIDQLVLDPLGPLHREPDRILMEEIPSTAELRPVLDAIGAGAHRVSEIGGRIGRNATSLSRPLERLTEMGIVRREIPFGEPARGSRRSLYRISDPFFRLWFRVVASQRGRLASASPPERRRILTLHLDALIGAAWEELCRVRLPRLGCFGKQLGFEEGSRWWRANDAEWDVVARSTSGSTLLFGEVKWSRQPVSLPGLRRMIGALAARPAPDLPGRFASDKKLRALFVPRVAEAVPRRISDVVVVTADDIIPKDEDQGEGSPRTSGGNLAGRSMRA